MNKNGYTKVRLDFSIRYQGFKILKKLKKIHLTAYVATHILLAYVFKFTYLTKLETFD